jgi:hypothetical protein
MPSRISKSPTSPRALSRLALAALAAAAVWTTPAHAAEVVVVGHSGAERVQDPFVPSQAEIALGPAPGSASVRAFGSAKAVGRALRRARITRSERASYRRAYSGARSTLRRLRGARRTELGYVVRSLEGIAAAGRLTTSRLPALFLQLRRNRAYWRSKPFPAAGDQISFRGSELLFQYFPGRGLQLHPLSNFKKANLLHGACSGSGRAGKPVCGARPPGPKKGSPCRLGRLRRLLDELSAIAVRRGSFLAWEYNFHFGGGSPPWMSGMAQSVAIVALGRASRTLKQPAYNVTAHDALGAFSTRSPVGVRTRGPMGGVHYLQYSFSRRLYIFNAFLQSLIGLYDYGRLAKDPVATRLFTEAEPEARREVPHSDVGDWSRYSFRGRESTHEYHELLREVLQGMGRRLGLTGPYCLRAIRYRGYQTDPPKLTLRLPPAAQRKRTMRVRFSLSKLSVVELRIFKGRKMAFRKLATFRRGSRAFSWRPKSAGSYRVRIAAKELRTGRSKRGRDSATLEVAP